MIGKKEWFRKKTFGWGLTPKTWQGWVYVAVLLVLIYLTFGINKWFGIILLLLIIDNLLVIKDIYKKVY